MLNEMERRFMLDRSPFPGLRLSRITFGMDRTLPLDVKQKSDKVACATKMLAVGADLFVASGERDIYRGWRLSDTDAVDLAELVSETEPYLSPLLRLRDSVAREALDGAPASAGRTAHGMITPPSDSASDDAFRRAGRVPMTVLLLLTRAQYAAVDRVLRDYMNTHRIDDIGAALEFLVAESAPRPA